MEALARDYLKRAEARLVIAEEALRNAKQVHQLARKLIEEKE